MTRRDSSKPWLSWIAVGFITLSLTLILAFGEAFNLWLATGIVGAVGLALGWVCLENRRCLLHFPVRLLGFTVLETMLLLAATYLGFWAMSAILPGMTAWTKTFYQQLNAPPGLPAALPVLLVMVLAEEVIWRGVFFDLMKRWLKGSQLVFTCSLAFCAGHLLSGQLWFSAMVLVLGIVWTAQRLVHNNLWVPILTHVIWNLAVMVYFPLVAVPG